MMYKNLKYFRFFGFLLALTCLSSIAFAQAAIAEETTNSPAAMQDDGFVPVDPAELETVSGKSLMLGAYAVIFIVLAGYTAALWRREARLERDISRLARRTGVNTTPK